MKTPVSNQQSQQSALSFNWDASTILGQDIRRVNLDDAHKLENQRHNHALLEKLKIMIKDAETEEKVKMEENTTYDVFSKYIFNACRNVNCPYKENISPHCANCLLVVANQIQFIISDDTIVYSTQQNIILNSEKDVKNFWPFFRPVNANGLRNTFDTSFQTYPPNVEELKAIFYWHREWLRLNLKNPILKQYFDIIKYSTPLHIIHYQIAQKLLLLFHTAEAFISHDDSSRQIAQLQRERNAVLYNKFQILPNINIDVEEKLAKRIERVKCIVHDERESTNTFANLTRTLFYISNGNTDTVDHFAIMLAKIFIGRPYLKYLDKGTNHLTLIITDNSQYIRNFLMDILSYNPMFDKNNYGETTPREHKYSQKKDNSYYHVTEYSAESLSDEKNIGEFIKDKIMGNIVNIDKTISAAGPNFKSIIEGTAISRDDPYFGKLRYKSNAHYIRINQDVRQRGLENYNISYDTILFNGNLTNAIYESLDEYELFFLVTGFVNYGIDLLSQTDKITITSPTLTELINEFIEKFCSDTTNTISLPSEVSAIEDDSKRLSKAGELGITKLPFIHVDILVECFEKWCSIVYKNSNYEKTLIRKNFISKYPSIFYQKKKAETLTGTIKDARGFYGLSFEKEKFIKFKNDLSAQSDESSPEEFISYMKNILKTYLLE